MNHFIVKLTSGEFVYGTIEDTKSKGMIIVKNPLTWQEYENEEGHLGSALVKYMTGTEEEEVPISTTSITSMARMSPTFEDFYEAAVAVQKITEEAYNENISFMTIRMIDLVMDYQDKHHAHTTGELVASSKSTIH